jgi:RNA polymerase sigma factor (sigma-70 family)
MANAALGGVVWHLRQAAFRSDAVTRSDGELLDRFRTDRDEAAFAALVRRHGPMVFGVCRRTLRNEADAEDAFQATFLVLARQAHVVSPAGRVGHWLYGVAHNTARKARTTNRRRLARERRAGQERRADHQRDDRFEMREVLDIELRRLPEPFRVAVIACDLEGESLQEAARRLGCPVGTVASRLARARQMLRRNLARRGLAVAALLAPGFATAAVPSRLAMLTTRAAIGAIPIAKPVLALTQGVIRAMFLAKVKFAVAAVVAAGVLVAGIGPGSILVGAGQDKPVKPPAVEQKPEMPVKPGADPIKPGDKPTKPEKPAGADVKKPAGFAGRVKSVDAAKGSITLTATKGDQSVDRTFTVASDAAVRIDGHEAKLADVKAGLHANVKIADDKTTAIAIGCEGPTLVGEVKEVAADRKSLKVVVMVPTDKADKKSPKKAEETSVNVGDDVRVAVEGNKKATLADLKTGASVQVQISADGTRAILIMSPAKGAVEPGLIGELKAVAADKKSVTVAVMVLAVPGDKSSAKLEDKTVSLADNVKVAVDGNKLSTVADLKVGSHVVVYLSKEADKAVAITASSRSEGEKKPVKPGAEKPAKPGADPTKPFKPGAEKPVKPEKP